MTETVYLLGLKYLVPGPSQEKFLTPALEDTLLSAHSPQSHSNYLMGSSILKKGCMHKGFKRPGSCTS